MSQIKVVVVEGLFYSRFVGRKLTHKVKADRPLTPAEVEWFRLDPVLMLDPEAA